MEPCLNQILSQGIRISKDQEVELGRRVKNGDLEARNELVAHNVRLVIHLAKHSVYERDLEFDDLVGYGMLGLIAAAERFDPDFGCQFSTYAGYYIRCAMQRGAQQHGRVIQLPVYVRELLARISNRQLDCLDEVELAKKLGCSVPWAKASIKALNLNRLDMWSDGSIPSIGDFGDNRHNPEEAALAKEKVELLNAQVHKAIAKLDARESRVIRDRFFNGKTLRLIGREMKMTKENVRLIQIRALRTLRENLGGQCDGEAGKCDPQDIPPAITPRRDRQGRISRLEQQAG